MLFYCNQQNIMFYLQRCTLGLCMRVCSITAGHNIWSQSISQLVRCITAANKRCTYSPMHRMQVFCSSERFNLVDTNNHTCHTTCCMHRHSSCLISNKSLKENVNINLSTAAPRSCEGGSAGGIFSASEARANRRKAREPI